MTERRAFFRELTQGAMKGARQALAVREQVAQDLSEVIAALTSEDPELASFDRGFFDSYELSYSMTLAYPREFFEQMADQAGLDHAGLETLELVKALHRRGAL